MLMEIFQNGGSTESSKIRRATKIESECSPVVGRLVWDQKLGCSIHPTPTNLGEVAQRLERPSLRRRYGGSNPPLATKNSR